MCAYRIWGLIAGIIGYSLVFYILDLLGSNLTVESKQTIGIITGLLIYIVPLFIWQLIKPTTRKQVDNSFEHNNSNIIIKNEESTESTSNLQKTVDGNTPGLKPVMKKCPFCAEEIKVEAIYCRYCRRDLPIQKETEIEDKVENIEPTIKRVNAPEMETRNIKTNNPLKIVILSIFGILIILFPISLGIFHSKSPLPAPSLIPPPTRNIELINEMSMVPPTLKVNIYPSATKSYFESNCVLWSIITISDVGKKICVYGNVYNITYDNIAYYISFSNKVNTFYLISYDIYFPKLRNGDCVFATGVIKRLDRSPVITLLPADHLYRCP